MGIDRCSVAADMALFSVSYECYNYALGTLELDISSYCDAHQGHSLTETSILSIPPFLSVQPLLLRGV